jgi:hypothetical protein
MACNNNSSNNTPESKLDKHLLQAPVSFANTAVMTFTSSCNPSKGRH